jgi:hypothetical protein
VLLTAYADTDVAIKAINDIGLDYYLLKPWDPPEERLYPVLDDLLGDWRDQHPDRDADVRVVGHRWSERSHEIKTFLARNHVPYRWLDLELDDEAGRLQDLAQAPLTDLPLVLIPDAAALRAPSTLDLASALGLRTTAMQPLYDLCIVGAVRPGCRGSLRGVRRPPNGSDRAGGPGRAGWPERRHRELPGVPEGPVRGRSHPPGGSAGAALRRGDCAGT